MSAGGGWVAGVRGGIRKLAGWLWGELLECGGRVGLSSGWFGCAHKFCVGRVKIRSARDEFPARCEDSTAAAQITQTQLALGVCFQSVGAVRKYVTVDLRR